MDWVNPWCGWSEVHANDGKAYSGSFIPEHGVSFRGYLRSRLNEVVVYIHKPPRGGACEHYRCLMLLSDDWFELHFTRAPQTFEAAVAYTEAFLSELMRAGATAA